jgi:hypothetical protein
MAKRGFTLIVLGVAEELRDSTHKKKPKNEVSTINNPSDAGDYNNKWP